MIVATDKKAIILGASSYIGKIACQAFGPDRSIGTYRSAPIPGGIYFDATQMRLTDIIGPELSVSHAVINYAETRIDACKADLARSQEVNVRSTKQVIDDLMDLGIKPVFISSEYVFDGEAGNYTEVDQPNPTTVYGSQKWKIERYLSERCDDYSILRLAKVFGTDPEDTTILSAWIKQIDAGEEIRCAKDQVFSPVHVDDVVAMTQATVDMNLKGVFHVSNSEPWSRLAMLQTLVEAMGAKAKIVECSIRDFDFLDNRPLDLSMSPGKMVATTGRTPKSVQACCEELLSKI